MRIWTRLASFLGFYASYEERTDLDWLVCIIKWQIGLLVLQVFVGIVFECPNLLSDSMYVALVVTIFAFSCWTEKRKHSAPESTRVMDILGILPTTISLVLILWTNISSMHLALIHNVAPRQRAVASVEAVYYLVAAISNFQLLRAFYLTRPDDFFHKLISPKSRKTAPGIGIPVESNVHVSWLNISFTFIQSFLDAMHGICTVVYWLSSWLHPVRAHYLNVAFLGATTFLALCALFSTLWRNPHVFSFHKYSRIPIDMTECDIEEI